MAHVPSACGGDAVGNVLREAASALRDRVPARLGGAAKMAHGTATQTRPEPIMQTFESVRGQLQELGIWGDESLLLISGDSNRVVLDAQGSFVSSPLFDRVHAPLALFCLGCFAREYASKGMALRASTDDMAQLLGAQVSCGDRPRADVPAFLVRDKGLLVTGRYEGELVAAALLVEKACRAELLAPRVGELRYLNPALCLAERAVYLASYSKHEREANDGRL